MHSHITNLNDLNHFRTAPILQEWQREILFEEVLSFICRSDWFTVGIMAGSSKSAISVIRQVEIKLKWKPMNIVSQPTVSGPVYLKANQKNEDIHIRIEYGLGEGIILCCHHLDPSSLADTFGPFPLDFFK